jgi:hypothetical protein
MIAGVPKRNIVVLSPADRYLVIFIEQPDHHRDLTHNRVFGRIVSHL